MTLVVTDTGPAADDWRGGFAPLAGAPAGAAALDLPADTDPLALAGRLAGVAMIRVAFPDLADGRGFSIARQLRLLGYRGRLRAAGRLLPDQYALARRAGFDEVEIPRSLLARQGEAAWRNAAAWRRADHQTRLGGRFSFT